MAFKDGKAKLVAVLVDLEKKTVSWGATGKSSKNLELQSSAQDEWMDLTSSPEKPFATLPTEPVSQSPFLPSRSQLRGSKSSCNLSKITAIHFGPVTNNMQAVVSMAKMQQPWRCWSFEISKPKPRTYDFVTLSDEDAEHFVLGKLPSRERRTSISADTRLKLACNHCIQASNAFAPQLRRSRESLTSASACSVRFGSLSQCTLHKHKEKELVTHSLRHILLSLLAHENWFLGCGSVHYKGAFYIVQI